MMVRKLIQSVRRKILNSKSYILFSDRKGISIIEAMVALGLLTGGLVTATQLVSSTISANRLISDQYIASYLGTEGIEIVKNLIDANKTQGNPWLTSIPLGDVALDYETRLVCTLPSCTAPLCTIRPKILCPYVGGRNLDYNQGSGIYFWKANGGAPNPNLYRFNRRVTINQISATEVEVISNITWVTRGNAQFSLDIYDHFFDWRP
jgi:hypothetical protein